jgi:pectin methylesterase-like acyl-CoA thioesterase
VDFLTILNKKTAKKLNIILTLTLLICSWTLVSIAGAASPSLVNVGVSTQGNYITMDAILTDGIEGKILEAIESGVPMTVTFQIELRKQVSLWNDTLIRSNEVSHTVQFDSLKKAYRFSEVGKNVKRKIITQKKDRYQQLMATLNNIPIAPIYQLDPAEKYYVQVKANLEMDRFWFPFNYLFFFVPFNNFETSWAKTSPLTIDQEFLNSSEAFNEKSKERAKSKALSHVIRSFNK